MADEEGQRSQRRAWAPGPSDGSGGLLSLSDDDLLFRVEELGPEHDQDLALLQIVCSDRHFFVRQEAAKKIRDHHLLKQHSHDRHIGQILVRSMTRREDVAYLEHLIRESRHIEVKKAAEAQLRVIRSRSEGTL